MKIGLTLPSMAPGLDRDAVLAWCRGIDEGPFSSLAIGERIAFDNLEQMTTLAAAATLTGRVELVATINILPLHSAALIAKQAATIDVLSGGRLTFGVGVGGREEDYLCVGVSFDHRLSRLDEQVSEMKKVWAGEPIAAGLAPVGPTPVQSAGPSVLAGAMSTPGFRHAAGWADGIVGFSFGPDPAEVDRQFRGAERAWTRAGRTSKPRLVTTCWYALGPKGRARMDAYVERYLKIFGKRVARSIAPRATTTDAVALREVIRSSAELGADELILVPTSADTAEIDRLAELI